MHPSDPGNPLAHDAGEWTAEIEAALASLVAAVPGARSVAAVTDSARQRLVSRAERAAEAAAASEAERLPPTAATETEIDTVQDVAVAEPEPAAQPIPVSAALALPPLPKAEPILPRMGVATLGPGHAAQEPKPLLPFGDADAAGLASAPPQAASRLQDIVVLPPPRPAGAASVAEPQLPAFSSVPPIAPPSGSVAELGAMRAPAHVMPAARIEPTFAPMPPSSGLGAVRPGTAGMLGSADVGAAKADEPQPQTAGAAPVDSPVPMRSPRLPFRRLLWRALHVLAIGLAVYLGVVAVLVVVFRFVDPPMSALMLLRAVGGQEITQKWVPLSGISPNLLRAVVVSEDAHFCTHHGVDLGEIKAAIARARDGIPRGASTISMQVVKNMFLWSSKSYVRKAIELPLTLYMELVWPKKRIFEVYANIAEWGPGIFGVEAAARHHFGKPAARLSESEAALLAVSLPNPIERDAGDPGPGTERLAHRIETRMRVMTQATKCLEARTPGSIRRAG